MGSNPAYGQTAIPGATTTPVGPANSQGNNVVVLQNPGMRAMSLGALQQRDEDDRRAAEQRQAAPLVTGLAGHIKGKFTVAPRTRGGSGDVEQRMLDNMRARRSVYTPQKLSAIQQEGGSEVYAGLTGNKCRAAAAWIRDVMMTTGEERPWSIKLQPGGRPAAGDQLPDPCRRAVPAQAADDGCGPRSRASRPTRWRRSR